MARSLNKVLLIGRLGADPEMRTTGTGMAVTTFSLATNRQWTAKDGNQQEETDWHNIVAWDRLAQICNEHLSRGRLVYIEGRIRTRSYESNGQKQHRTEIVASDMLMLESTSAPMSLPDDDEIPVPRKAVSTSGTAQSGRGRRQVVEAEVLDDPDDIPF